ncbi:MAG TPA: exodeoxyribonuclease VII small subunit [Rhizomicrobium sp.]|nr:exodeoxyribonuclease VII small subunit [Rhizomicrobium sp.]
MVRCSFGGTRNDTEELEPAISPSSNKASGTDKVIEELSFEGALKELEAIVSRLEQGEVDLEDSIALYERGQALKSHCEKKLKSAEGRLEKIVLGAGGPEIGEKMETA